MKAVDEVAKIKAELYLETMRYSLSLIKAANSEEEELSSGSLAAINGILKYSPDEMKVADDREDLSRGLRELIKDVSK